MDNRIAELEQEVKSLKAEIKELRSKNEEVLELFKDNVKSVALSKNMKQKGPGNPRYKTDVKTGEVEIDYILSGFQITTAMIKKYKMSYQGLRLRLIKAGVWKENQEQEEKK